MANVIREIEKHSCFRHLLIASGQQDSLFHDTITALDVSVAEHLGHNPGSVGRDVQIDSIQDALGARLARIRPQLVLVQGDTNTALAAARAAARLNISVGHIEAGLRSHDATSPYPEEINRVEIAQLASLHFAPSIGAANNLEVEKVAGLVCVTGNPGIDSLVRQMTEFAPHLRKQPQILVTCHRRENFGAPLKRICGALQKIADTGIADLLIPLHSNPAVSQPVLSTLGNHPHIRLITPLDYPEMVLEIRRSALVLSDSGGLQEECAALGVPMLLMRSETERPEVISSGNCRLVGSDARKIIAEVRRLLTDAGHHSRMAVPSWPYGNGKAATKIVSLIANWSKSKQNAPALSLVAAH